MDIFIKQGWWCETIVDGWQQRAQSGVQYSLIVKTFRSGGGLQELQDLQLFLTVFNWLLFSAADLF